jgi:hypothetical protein
MKLEKAIVGTCIGGLLGNMVDEDFMTQYTIITLGNGKCMLGLDGIEIELEEAIKELRADDSRLTRESLL